MKVPLLVSTLHDGIGSICGSILKRAAFEVNRGFLVNICKRHIHAHYGDYCAYGHHNRIRRGFCYRTEDIYSQESPHFAHRGGQSIESGSSFLREGLSGENESGQIGTERQREEQETIHGEQRLLIVLLERIEESGQQHETESNEAKPNDLQHFSTNTTEHINGEHDSRHSCPEGDELLLTHIANTPIRRHAVVVTVADGL
mmetsp:Transcript_31791/g.43389  ORF Transcript_31791/g.43389 Transcript_31791/m.43389 type:complete len:201 (+) Transcript_31791:118-720(+)